ncbi:MAG: nuclear transport factor 2 family protein [Myxococcota bacterium]|nr:nuclear transport factor 2 family protein [Myxococcota bacterium]
MSDVHPTNRVRALVHLWMSIWDRNDGDAAPLLDLLSPEGFAIHVTTQPDPITTAAGVRAWFGEFAKKVSDDEHQVESVAIAPLEAGAYRVEIHVRCPGTAITGQPFLVSSVHTWEVVDYGGFVPRIRRLEAKLTGQG